GDTILGTVPLDTVDAAVAGPARVNAIATDLLTRTAYAFTDGGDPVDSDVASVDGIAPIDVDGNLGTVVPLSRVVDLDQTAVLFSGAGRVAIRVFHELAIVDPLTGI